MGLLSVLSINKKNKKVNVPQTAEDFHSLYEDNPDAIFMLDDAGKVISINQNLTVLLGYGLHEKALFRENFLLQNKNIDKIRYHFHKASQGVITTFDTIINHKNGYGIPVQITLIPSSQEKETGAIFGLCKDLTNVQSFEQKVNLLNHQLDESQKVTNIGNWDIDIPTGKVYWSPQTLSIFGVQEVGYQPTFENVLDFVSPKDKKVFKKNFNRILTEKKTVEFEHRLIRKDGQERTVLLRSECMLDEDGNVSRIIGTIQDVTKQKLIESKLEESESLFESVTNHLPVAIWSYNVIQKKMTFCSHGIEDIYGVSPETFQADSELWLKFVHPEDRPTIEKNHKDLSQGKELNQQYRILDATGEVKWVHAQIIPYFDMNGTRIRLDGIVRDITEKMTYTDSLAFIADHDYLTKLPNRRFFERKLEEWIQSSSQRHEKFAVYYLDLDRFKYINDTLGHEIGDQFLVSFSKRLKEYLGSSTFLARIGGDEFSICLKNIEGIDEAISLAKEIISEIEKPFYIEDYELFVTTSIGISLYPMDGEDSRTLLRNADTALYKAKDAGRNDWQVFSSSMNVESFKLYQLEKDLRKSLINEELYVDYQPKVDPKTSKIVGAEALVRWKHPEWGIVSPGEFIPLAEENGFIFKIGDWVLSEVCEMLSRWEKQGLPVVPVSVNVSPKRLLKAGFVQTIQDTILSAGINPSLIEFELTEQTVIQNTEVAKNIIAELKAFGVKIALDDFGTGFSSLSYLKDLDIDTLKIDKSFIDGITINKANEAIIKSLIFLSKEVEINLVAEGVETKEQLNFLLQQECQQIQGYIYSKPISEARFIKLLKKEFLQPLQTTNRTEQMENRRSYFRIQLICPLTANMTIVKFKGKDVKLGTSRAVIEDLSLGGLRFTSSINLPVQKDIIIQFSTVIMGVEVQFVGSNVWKLEVDGLFQYGFEFAFNEADRDKLAPILNKVILQLKQCAVLPESSILQENKLGYLEG